MDATILGDMAVRSEPPSRSRPMPPVPESWVDLLKPCQDGSWWLVRTYDLKRSAIEIASHLRRGVKAIPPGRWEFQAGETDDGRYGVWARRLSD